jgi:hypothetical protein
MLAQVGPIDYRVPSRLSCHGVCAAFAAPFLLQYKPKPFELCQQGRSIMQTSGGSPYERLHVAESFNIYLATQQIISILSAIIFIALITLLATNFDHAKTVTVTMPAVFGMKSVSLVLRVEQLYGALIWLLTLCEMSLLTALIAFHATATQVYTRWKIYFPRSLARGIGAIFMTIGIFLTLASIAMFLLISGYVLQSLACVAFLPLWVAIIVGMKSLK